MSECDESGFAFVRQPECAALMRCKASAALAFIYIRSVLAKREDQPFLCGSRDLKGCGLGRDAAAGALRELEREGLIKCEDRGSFTRGKKATWRIVHTKETVKNTAGKPANPKTDTAGLSANSGRKTRQLDQNTAGKPATPKETSSTSSQKSKEEEVSSSIEDEAGREERRQAFKESLRRIECAAKVVALTDAAFIRTAGGREPADFLSRKYDRGEINAQQLRARLMAGEERAFEGEREGLTPRTIASNGAA